MTRKNVSYIYDYVEARYGGFFETHKCTDKHIKKIVLKVPESNHRSFHYWDRRFDKSKTIESVKAMLATAFLTTVERSYIRVK